MAILTPFEKVRGLFRAGVTFWPESARFRKPRQKIIDPKSRRFRVRS